MVTFVSWNLIARLRDTVSWLRAALDSPYPREPPRPLSIYMVSFALAFRNILRVLTFQEVREPMLEVMLMIFPAWLNLRAGKKCLAMRNGPYYLNSN